MGMVVCCGRLVLIILGLFVLVVVVLCEEWFM